MVSVLQHSIHIIKIYFSLEPKKTVMFKLKHFKNLISFYSQTVFYHFFQHPPFINIYGQQGILDVEITAEFDKAVFRLSAF